MLSRTSDNIVMLPASPSHLMASFLFCLTEPGKHKHRKCERPLSAQLSKPVIVPPGSKRYVFVIPQRVTLNSKPIFITILKLKRSGLFFLPEHLH